MPLSHAQAASAMVHPRLLLLIVSTPPFSAQISLQTLKQAVRSHLMPNLTDDDFNVLFEKIDMDGDGLISFDDFAALSIQMRAQVMPMA